MRSMKSLAVGVSVVLMLVGLANPVLSEMTCKKVIDSSKTAGTTGAGDVSSSQAATSDKISLQGHRFFSYQSQCTSASGTAEYDLEFYTATMGNEDYRVQFGTDLIDNDTTETWTAPTSIKPPPAAFGWFVVRDNGSTPADTQCDVIFCRD